MGVSELHDHLRIRPTPPPGEPGRAPLYRRWLRTGSWVVPVMLALSVGTALIVTSRQTPTYSSAATVALVPGPSVADGPDVLRSLETLERRTVIATFAQIPLADRIQQAAAHDISLPGDSLAGYRTLAFVIPNTNLIRIEVEGPDPTRTAALANALLTTTAAEAKAMYRVFELTALARAVRPTAPVAPNPKRAVALAAILGMFLGLAATYLLVRPPRPSVTPT